MRGGVHVCMQVTHEVYASRSSSHISRKRGESEARHIADSSFIMSDALGMHAPACTTSIRASTNHGDNDSIPRYLAVGRVLFDQALELG